MAVNTKVTYHVVDASFLLSKLLLDEESSKNVISTFELYKKGRVNLVAPALLRYEVGNTLRSSVLRKRLTKSNGIKIYSSFLKMKIEYLEIDFEQVLKVALEKHTSLYDASYLWLAKSKKLTLLTLDKKLAGLSKKS